MERVQRWREAAVVVVVVVLLLRAVLVLTFALSTLRLGVNGAPDAAYLASRQLADPTLYVVLAALLVCCHLRPATAHARALAALAAGVAGASLLLVLGLAVYGYTTYAAPFSQLDLADRLAAAVVPLLAVGLLGLLAAGPRRGATAPADDAAVPADPPAVTGPTADPAPDPARQPVWTPDAAAGAAWTTAGEAAAGQPARAWGTPTGTGWGPAADPPPTGAPETPADQGEQPGDDDPHPWRRPVR